MKASWLSRGIVALRVLLLVLVCVFPFAWMALSSIKSLNELYTVPPVWLPKMPTLDNYQKMLFASNVPRYFLNSTVISLGATSIALILAIFAPMASPASTFAARPQRRPSSSSASCCRQPPSSCRSS